MSTNRKFYYIKLKEDYFHQNNIKILESQENGYIYSLILLKMYLQACNSEGCLMMTPTIPYDPTNVGYLAKVIGHDVDHVKETIRWCLKLDLITVFDTGQMWLNDMEKMIGHSSTEAERIAEYRRRLKKQQLQGPEDSQKEEKNSNTEGVYKCTPEQETETEIEIKQEQEQEQEPAAAFYKKIQEKIEGKIGYTRTLKDRLTFILSSLDEKEIDDFAEYLITITNKKHPKNAGGWLTSVLAGEDVIKKFRSEYHHEPDIKLATFLLPPEEEENGERLVTPEEGISYCEKIKNDIWDT